MKSLLIAFTILPLLFVACTRKNPSNGTGYSGRPLNTVISVPTNVQVERIEENRYRFSAPAGTVKRAEGPVEETKLSVWNVNLEEIQRIGSSTNTTESINGSFVTSFSPLADGSFQSESSFTPAMPYFLVFVSDVGDTANVAIPAAKDSSETTAVYSKLESGVPSASGTVFREAFSTTTQGPAATTAAAPTISTVSPSTGYTFGGVQITVSGSDFSSGARITIDGLPCNNTVRHSSVSMTCHVPAHAAATVTVTVTNSDNQSNSKPSAFQYLAPPTPAITGITPDAGPITGGTNVTITGSGFLPGATVALGSAPCGSVVVKSPTQLICLTGITNSAAIVAIQVTNPGNLTGTLPAAFSYYDPDANTWRPTSATGAPGARRYHTAIWTDAKMIVWGGFGGSHPQDYYNTGGIYDPATDSWSPTSTTIQNPVGPATTLESRGFHSAAWIQNRMLIFGGKYEWWYYDAGESYDPVTNTWTRLSSVNQPEARHKHTSVVINNKMYIWGGMADHLTPQGFRYDPSSDTWTTINLTGFPEGRIGHTAIVAGNKMIVWGGTDEMNYRNEGGIYDPATDSWTSVTLVSAPAARTGHSAVWTGSKMIVWGGQRGWNLADGGVYDLQANSWSATSLTNPPAGRSYHTAVWTGARMIIWGGVSGNGFDSHLTSGSSYDPISNNWTAITEVNVPVGRGIHTAIWTGSKMIIWGGGGKYPEVPTLNYNSGGVYTP